MKRRIHLTAMDVHLIEDSGQQSVLIEATLLSSVPEPGDHWALWDESASPNLVVVAVTHSTIYVGSFTLIRNMGLQRTKYHEIRDPFAKAEDDFIIGLFCVSPLACVACACGYYFVCWLVSLIT